MRYDIHRVTDPETLTLDEIKGRYWDNFVLVSNTKKGSLAGVVRYLIYRYYLVACG